MSDAVRKMGHRTSNPVDRLLRRLEYHPFCTQHLHGSITAAERGLRCWALIHIFAPLVPFLDGSRVSRAAETG
jgi:hypothetical protein